MVWGVQQFRASRKILEQEEAKIFTKTKLTFRNIKFNQLVRVLTLVYLMVTFVTKIVRRIDVNTPLSC